MPLREKWNSFWRPAVALAFDREGVWSVNAADAEPRRSAACVAVDARSRKVVAVGDEAAGLRARGIEGVTIVDYARSGTLADFGGAEAAFRRELRVQRRGKWGTAPRVLVATSQRDAEKWVVKDAAIQAGAREVITIPRLMAAAIGTGIDVEASRAETVVYLDRDWCGIAVIARSAMLASWEGEDALDQVSAEKAWLEREPGDERARDFDAMYRRLWSDGVADDTAGTMLARRLRERYRAALATLPSPEANAARSGAVHLVGPCATLPGLKALLAACWGMPVIVPPRPDAVAILGCRKLLGELDWILTTAK